MWGSRGNYKTVSRDDEERGNRVSERRGNEGDMVSEVK